MVTTLVYVAVKPEFIDSFKMASIANSLASQKETGNLRFDVLQSDQDPTSFVLYEAYANKEQALAHKQTAHYAVWRDTVAPMMAEPRKGVPYTGTNPVGH